jgi:hypothetical protein
MNEPRNDTIHQNITDRALGSAVAVKTNVGRREHNSPPPAARVILRKTRASSDSPRNRLLAVSRQISHARMRPFFSLVAVGSGCWIELSATVQDTSAFPRNTQPHLERHSVPISRDFVQAGKLTDRLFNPSDPQLASRIPPRGGLRQKFVAFLPFSLRPFRRFLHVFSSPFSALFEYSLSRRAEPNARSRGLLRPRRALQGGYLTFQRDLCV